jgi:tetratricopeptide (TPR) repeat protein
MATRPMFVVVLFLCVRTTVASEIPAKPSTIHNQIDALSTERLVGLLDEIEFDDPLYENHVLADRICTELLRRAPPGLQPHKFHCRRSIALRALGQLEAAARDASKAIELDATCELAYLVRGRSSPPGGQALLDVRRAIEIAPTDFRSWIGQGAIEVQLGRFDNAERSFEQAKRLGMPPSDSLEYAAYLRLARKYDRALDQIDQFISNRGYSQIFFGAVPYELRASQLYSMGRYREAFRDAFFAMRTDPSLQMAHGRLILSAMKLRRYSLALHHTDTLLTQYGNQPDLLLVKSTALLHLGRHSDALKCLPGPDDGSISAIETLLLRAQLRMCLGEIDEAILDLRKCLRINPRDESALLLSGLAHLYKSQSSTAHLTEAVTITRRLRDQSPTHRYAATYLLAIAEFRAGQRDAAVQAVAQVRDALPEGAAQPFDYVPWFSRQRVLSDLDKIDRESHPEIDVSFKLNEREILRRELAGFDGSCFAEHDKRISQICKALLSYDLEVSERAHVLARLAESTARCSGIDAGIASINSAIELMPGNAALYATRARIKLSQNVTPSDDLLQEALSDFRVAIQRDPRNAEACAFLGYVSLKRGLRPSQSSDETRTLLKEADEWTKKAVDIHPDNAFCRYMRGVVREQMGDANGTLKELNECLRLDPIPIAPYLEQVILLRSAAHAAKGQQSLALADAAWLLTLKPNDPTATMLVVFAYMRLEKPFLQEYWKSKLTNRLPDFAPGKDTKTPAAKRTNDSSATLNDSPKRGGSD